jgi:hypothetical protein
MEKPNKEDIMKKWAPILNSMGVTGSKATCMSEYAEIHSNHTIEENTLSTEYTSNDFPSLLPISKKIVAKTVGLDIVAVKPMNSPGGTSEETMERIKAEVKAENRQRKINNVLEDEEYKEMDITEHEDYNGPNGSLLYMDFVYGGSTQSNKSTSEMNIKKL